MKSLNWVKWRIMPLILLCPMLGLGQGVPSPGDTSHDWLNHWSFSDTNAWPSDLGYAPRSFTNLNGSELGDSLALVLDSTNPAWLQYKVNEDDGTTNLTVGTGSVLLWFAAAWSSTNQGGT